MSGHSGRKQKREFKRRLQRIFGRDILDPKILPKVDFCDRNSRKLLVGFQHVNRWQNCLADVSSYECIDLYRFLVAVLADYIKDINTTVIKPNYALLARAASRLPQINRRSTIYSIMMRSGIMEVALDNTYASSQTHQRVAVEKWFCN